MGQQRDGIKEFSVSLSAHGAKMAMELEDHAHILDGRKGGLPSTERQASQLRQVPSKSFTHPFIGELPLHLSDHIQLQEKMDMKV